MVYGQLLGIGVAPGTQQREPAPQKPLPGTSAQAPQSRWVGDSALQVPPGQNGVAVGVGVGRGVGVAVGRGVGVDVGGGAVGAPPTFTCTWSSLLPPGPTHVNL